jgi:protein SCO1/2
MSRIGRGARTTVGAIALIVALAAGCGSTRSATPADADATTVVTNAAGLAGTLVTPPAARPSFVLTDTSGQPYDFAQQTAGRLTLLYFGYTNCPDICQTTMSELAAVQSRPGTPPATVVFVTVDPARDTAPVLRQWLDHFDAGFVGLTGTPAQVEAAEQAAKVPVATRAPGGSGDEYFMSHPGVVLAFAPDDHGYTRYDFGTTVSQFQFDLGVLAGRTAGTGATSTSTATRP